MSELNKEKIEMIQFGVELIRIIEAHAKTNYGKNPMSELEDTKLVKYIPQIEKLFLAPFLD